MILPRQLRAARADLMLTLDDVSGATGIAKTTISDIETQKTDHPRAVTLDMLQTFYEAQGIMFQATGGISPRHLKVDQYIGEDGFRAFMNDVYEVAKTMGGDIRLHNAKPTNWLKWLGRDWLDMHGRRMEAIMGTLTFRITAGHGDTQLIANHAEYRWLPRHLWTQQSFYAYGDRLALLTFGDDMVHVVVIYNQDLARSFRALFDVAWDTIATTPEVGHG